MTNDRKLSGSTDIEPANKKRSPVLPPDAELTAVAGRLVDQARDEGIALTREGGLLTGLIQQVMQTALEAELTEHLGYEPHAVEGRGSGNSRNGYYPKTVRTEIGDVTVDVPRDRQSPPREPSRPTPDAAHSALHDRSSACRPASPASPASAG